jgi:hypothetical protein
LVTEQHIRGALNQAQLGMDFSRSQLKAYLLQLKRKDCRSDTIADIKKFICENLETTKPTNQDWFVFCNGLTTDFGEGVCTPEHINIGLGRSRKLDPGLAEQDYDPFLLGIN